MKEVSKDLSAECQTSAKTSLKLKKVTCMEKMNTDIKKTSSSRQSWSNSTRKEKTHKFLSKQPMLVLTLGMTCYALFADDFRVMSFSAKHDESFVFTHCLCILYFIFEISIYMWAKPGFYKSIFAFLDIAALISLVFDVVMLKYELKFEDGGTNQWRAARAARVATRVSRLIRALRLAVSMKRWCTNRHTLSTNLEPDNSEDKTRFGKYLTVVLIRKVVLGVLLMVALLPHLQYISDKDVNEIVQTYVDDWYRCLNDDTR